MREARVQTVILAQGDFPKRGGRAWRILAEAKRVVACDGAARAYRRRLGKWPDVIVGDLDSLGVKATRLEGVTVVKVAEQETNDLEKALNFCCERGWRDVVVVGATGRREDHTLGNVFRALDRGVRMVTDYGEFHPVCGRASFQCNQDCGVSVFAPDPRTRMTSTGLRWPLGGVQFVNLYCATLNRTCGRRFTVTSDRPVYVYIEVEREGRNA